MGALSVDVASEALPHCAARFRIAFYDDEDDEVIVTISTGGCHLQTYMTAAELGQLSAALLSAKAELEAKESA